MKNNESHMIRINEAIGFEDFILSCFYDYIDKNKSYTGVTDEGFDVFFPNGHPDICNEPFYLEVKYVSRISNVFNYIQSRKAINYKLYIIVPLEIDKIPEKYTNYNITILGKSFVEKLIRENTAYWWIYISSLNTSKNLIYDDSRKVIKYDSYPVLSCGLDSTVELKSDEIELLSKANEFDFKTRCKSNKNPAIIIGNGVSIPFGSDSWNKLADSIYDYMNPKYVDNLSKVKKAIGDTVFSTTSIAKETIDPKKYNMAIYNSIYRKYEQSMHNDSTLLRAIVNEKNKNQNMPIITYNYDNFFEIDYRICYGVDIKTVGSSISDKVIGEPKVVHIHGSMPYNNTSGKTKLILTQYDYYSEYKGSRWVSMKQKKILENNTCLFVGSSMSDLFQMSLINDVRNKALKNNFNRKLWKCFALMCLNGMTARDKVAIFNYYLNKGIHIIFTEEYEQLATKFKTLFD